MTDASKWREQALQSLADAVAEVEASTEPMIVVAFTITVSDFDAEKPVSVYANQSWPWLKRFTAFVAWRLSLRDESPLIPSTAGISAPSAEMNPEDDLSS